MKQIVKGMEPESFKTWRVRRLRDENCSWKEFSKTEEYRELKTHLHREQAERCCYCEVWVRGDADSHIEHYKPRVKYSNEEYDYENLLLSCAQKDSCGHKKQAWYDDGMVSPSGDCESRFTYTSMGQIIPSKEEDDHARATIKILGLNCQRLQGRRYSIVRALEECDNSLLAEELANCNEWHCGFYTLIEYLLEKSEQ